MTPATISLGALLLAILLSCFARVNIGVLALLLAWVVGVGFGGMTLKQVAAGFPIELFLTMVGVTLLFTQARLNGLLLGNGTEDASAIKAKMQEIMTAKVGIFRRGQAPEERAPGAVIDDLLRTAP